MDKTFIERNKNFWADFIPVSTGKKVLIEEPSIPIITHLNAIFSLILNQAKGLTPVWLYSGNYGIEFLKSYIPTAGFVAVPKRSWLSSLMMLSSAICKFIKILLTGDILSFSYDGVKYGDIIYDVYLTREKVGTIRSVNLKLVPIIYLCIRRHEETKKILKSDNYEAVLIGHQIGLYSGVMMRAALRYGYKVYLRAGNFYATFSRFDDLSEVYNVPLQPSLADIHTLINKLGNGFEQAYQAVFNKEVSGGGTYDGKYAFSSANKYYKERESFARDFGLDTGKKNVFFMLHAFNDYPHILRWLIFKDYYDWFIQSLYFVKTKSDVNWIFKQHPSIKFYPAKDVDFQALFSTAPKNVTYINETKQIDTRSLAHCADLIITCIGAAGFEVPAMARIPSVTAGDNFYTGLGFALEPRTKKEYFEILSNAKNIERLSKDKQKIAQAAYMYINYFSRIKVSACPLLSHDEEKDKDCNLWFWQRVNELYDSRHEVIKEEIRTYIKEVSKNEFKRLSLFQMGCYG